MPRKFVINNLVCLNVYKNETKKNMPCEETNQLNFDKWKPVFNNVKGKMLLLPHMEVIRWLKSTFLILYK